MMVTQILEQVINGLLAGAYYLLIALGLSLIFSLGGLVNLAHGAFYAIGAYFAVKLGDKLGFAGVMLVIALFVVIVLRAVAIARQAAVLERSFAALIAHGIGLWLGVQALINMGVLPTKGLTLPLLSFGGSGIAANCIALAVLLRVDWENRQRMRGMSV